MTEIFTKSQFYKIKCIQIQRVLYDTEQPLRSFGQGFSAKIQPVLPKYDVAYFHSYTLFNGCFTGYLPLFFKRLVQKRVKVCIFVISLK